MRVIVSVFKQKLGNIDRFSKLNSTNTSVQKGYSNRNSLGSKNEQTPRALICISDNISNTKLLQAPKYVQNDQKLEEMKQNTVLSSDSSSAATIGYGKHITISSDDSTKEMKYPDLEIPTSKYSNHHNRIDEVNESMSEPDIEPDKVLTHGAEKTVEASAVAKYSQNIQNLESRTPNDHHILNDENMRTQKNTNK